MRPSTAVAGGLLAAAGVAVLLRLSAWQWERARTGGSLVNYTYAVEWMLLAVALVVGPLVQRHRGARSSCDDAASRDADGRVVGPPLRPGEELAEVTRVRLRRWVSRRAR